MSSLTSVPLPLEFEESSFFETIPDRPAVFALALRASMGEIPPPYLGRTQNLRRRLMRLLRPSGTVSKLLNLRELTTAIEYQLVGSQLEALVLLFDLNRRHYPRNYRQRLRLKSPVLLKLNLRNRFPRCYPARRISNDGSRHYGPFPSRPAAERFASDFLDLFKIRRCVEDLDPDPAHPGCIYSQMKMCLAPCFRGCSDEEYQDEVARVAGFLDANPSGDGLIRSLEAERSAASESLEFENAARLHRRIEKVQEVSRQKPDIVRNIADLNAIVVERGATTKSVVFFRILGGELRGPVALSLDENVASPVPLDKQLHELLDPLGSPVPAPGGPPWEHLSLLARWYYSSFRTGEILMLDRSPQIPHARLIRLCRKLIAQVQ